VALLAGATTLLIWLGLASSAWGANAPAAWGRGDNGRLGDGSNSNLDVPTTVLGLSEVQSVSAGGDHGLALMKNGTVEAWGDNEYGQLGNGTTTSSGTPVAVSGLEEVVEVSAGAEFSLARLANGKVMAWGRDNVGQLGNGGSGFSDVPVEVSGLSGVTEIASGNDESWGFALALLSNHTVKAWGSNNYGTLGDGSEEELSRTPVAVSELSEVASIAAGSNHALAVLSVGTVKAWGMNNSGQIGNGTETGPSPCGFGFKCFRTPTSVIELSEVAAVSAGFDYSVALTTSGEVATWGWGFYGELGGREGPTDAARKLKGLSEVTQISAGEHHVLALLGKGTVEAWGQNNHGQIGNGASGSDVTVPTKVGELSHVEDVSAGGEFSLSAGAPGPIVTGIEPDQGPTGGGTTVAIVGTHFTGLKAADFGGSAASSFSSSSSTSASAVSPAKKPATVPVTLENENGITSAPDTASLYTYVPGGALQLGRCLNVGTGKGKYKRSTCTELAEGGKFEWFPEAVKAAFTIADASEKIGEPKPITLASSKSTLSCTNATGSGSYLGNKAVTAVVVKFTGCALGGAKCSSAGAAEGEVVTDALAGGVGWREKSANTVGLDLGQEELVFEAVCGSSTVKVRGSAVSSLGPVNNMTASFTLKFKVTAKGVQTPEGFEGEPNEFFEMSVGGGAFEQAGLTFEALLNNEEELQVNTVV
jgi:alpha-tubulin suppressor-like RCC1 family protein